MSLCMRCSWKPDRDAGPDKTQLAEHAIAAGHPLCVVDGRSLGPLEAQTCAACLRTTGEHLAGIVAMYDELPRHLGHARAQRYDAGPRGGEEFQLPGGTVLALLAPGGTGNAARKLTASDIARGMDGREHKQDNEPDDAPSVAWALATWEDDWRNTRGEPAAVVAGGTGAVVRAARDYLEQHAAWAAREHPAFDEYASDLRELHTTLERATGRVRLPVTAGADCFRCGSKLIRPLVEVSVSRWWLPGAVGPLPAGHPQARVFTGVLEQSDTYVCSGCSDTYDQTRYSLALAAKIEAGSRIEVDGEVFVTLAVAARETERAEQTMRNWANEGRMRRHELRGITLVNLDEALAESYRCSRRQRRASA